MRDYAESEVVDIPIDRLDVHPVNAQLYIDTPERRRELIESVREHGILQPLIVMPESDGRFTVLSGVRRLVVAKELGLKTVPCLVRVVSNPIIAIIEFNR